MNYKKPTLWIVVVAAVICILVAGCSLAKPNTGDNEKINNATGEIADSSENTAEQLLNGEIIDLEDRQMTAAQLISAFVNGGKEMLDCPVNQDVYIAKSDVQQTATIHSIVVKTATVTFRYTYDADAVQEPGEFEDVKVVLIDGTVINVLGPYGVPGDNGEFVSTYMAIGPIPKEDIDYIQIGEVIVAITQITHQGNPMIPAP